LDDGPLDSEKLLNAIHKSNKAKLARSSSALYTLD
jgi:hypothetical protein